MVIEHEPMDGHRCVEYTEPIWILEPNGAAGNSFVLLYGDKSSVSEADIAKWLSPTVAMLKFKVTGLVKALYKQRRPHGCNCPEEPYPE